jgi:hypothetical protein
MEFYVKMLMFIGVMAIVIPVILFFTGLINQPFLKLMYTTNSPYYNSANTVVNAGNNSLIYVFPTIILIGLALGIVVDLWIAVKMPSLIVGIANIFGVFILVGIWLVLNSFIYNSQILVAFGQPNNPLYQMFASGYLITGMCAAILISASLHLSGKAQSNTRQP